MYLGSEVDITFELPRNGVVETRAETAYQLVPDLGLVFAATPAAQRHAIASFVEQTLADLERSRRRSRRFQCGYRLIS